MNNSDVLEMVSTALWTVVMVSAPVVIAAAAAGLLTSVVQILVQIQDQTMQFLIKLTVVIVVLTIAAGWMSTSLINYANMMFERIGGIR
jgi:type III secretion HrpO family protein